MQNQKNQSTAVAETATANSDFERLLTGPVSFGPRSMPEAVDFSKKVSASQLVPKDYQGRPENVFAAIQWGAEIGLSPMQALQGIAIINGRPSLWGDVMLALVMNHPAYEWHKEGGDEKHQWFIIKRKGQEEYTVTFSLEDAKKAGLISKQGPWTNYPKRMMQMRARGFALRDKFPDALKGMISREEAMDYPEPSATAAPRPAPVHDTTGELAEPIQMITEDQVEALIVAMEKLGDISGTDFDAVLIKLDAWYASKRDGEALPDLPGIHPDDYAAVLGRVQSWITATEKQNAAAVATETETETTE